MDVRDHIYSTAPGVSQWKIDFDLHSTGWEGSKNNFYRFATKTEIIHNLLRIMYYIDKWGFVHTTNPNTGEE